VNASLGSGENTVHVVNDPWVGKGGSGHAVTS
jgi:hypothetical protein